jgi:hypothetical protein
MKIEEITFIGILLTFIVGAATLYITIRNTRKTNFINSITASRIKYIQELRTNLSRFCGVVTNYNSRNREQTNEDLLKIQLEYDKLKYLLKLYLNPEDEYWDNEMMRLIKDIRERTDKDPNQCIEELIVITQYLLKLEWEGAKLESQKGPLSFLQKKELYNKYVELHKRYLLKNNINHND